MVVMHMAGMVFLGRLVRLVCIKACAELLGRHLQLNLFAGRRRKQQRGRHKLHSEQTKYHEGARREHFVLLARKHDNFLATFQRISGTGDGIVQIASRIVSTSATWMFATKVSSCKAIVSGRPSPARSKTHDKLAALKFLRKALRNYGAPCEIVTDRLRSYRAAMSQIGNGDRQVTGLYLNNFCETSHQPFRRGERAMSQF